MVCTGLSFLRNKKSVYWRILKAVLRIVEHVTVAYRINTVQIHEGKIIYTVGKLASNYEKWSTIFHLDNFFQWRKYARMFEK